jgi:GT2 family glycosyltransferase
MSVGESPPAAPRIAVVIVAFDSGPHLQTALNGLERQTFRDFEIILWDNASQDGAAADARLPENARRFRSEENLGFAAGNNRAARETRAELLALLNPDAVPEPVWLERLVAALDANPRAVMAASRQVCADAPDRLDGLGDVFHIAGVAYRGGFGASSATQAPAGEVFAPCGASALYRRAAFDAAGGFDERFFCYAEDVDLGFRLQLAGRACWYVAGAVVHHMGSASAVSGSPFAVYHGHRNLEWMYLKNMPAALFWRYLPLHLAAVVAGGAWFTLRGRGGSFVRAKLDAIGGAGHAWRARRAVQASRQLSSSEVRGLLDRGSLWTRLRRPAG